MSGENGNGNDGLPWGSFGSQPEEGSKPDGEVPPALPDELPDIFKTKEQEDEGESFPTVVIPADQDANIAPAQAAPAPAEGASEPTVVFEGNQTPEGSAQPEPQPAPEAQPAADEGMSWLDKIVAEEQSKQRAPEDLQEGVHYPTAMFTPETPVEEADKPQSAPTVVFEKEEPAKSESTIVFQGEKPADVKLTPKDEKPDGTASARFEIDTPKPADEAAQAADEQQSAVDFVQEHPSVFIPANAPDEVAQKLVDTIDQGGVEAIVKDKDFIPQSSSPNAPLAGKEFGDYIVERLLGRGGMGSVYLGKHKETGKLAALKILKIPPVDPTNILYQNYLRMQREASALDMLDHQNIVNKKTSGTIKMPDFEELDPAKRDEGEFYFIAMEYVPHISLAERIKIRRTLSVDEVLDVIEQVACALSHGHGRGMAHRDTKVENMFLMEDGTVKVGDYGLVKFNDQSLDGGITGQFNTVMGTLEDMAPEQGAGEWGDPAKADQYQLASAMMRLLTGRPTRSRDRQAERAQDFSWRIFSQGHAIDKDYQEKKKDALAKGERIRQIRDDKNHWELEKAKKTAGEIDPAVKDDPLNPRLGERHALIDPILEGMHATMTSFSQNDRYDSMDDVLFVIRGIKNARSKTLQERVAEEKKAAELLEECIEKPVRKNTAIARERLRKIGHYMFFCEGELRWNLMHHAVNFAIPMAQGAKGEDYEYEQRLIRIIKKDQVLRGPRIPPENITTGSIHSEQAIRKGEVYQNVVDSLYCIGKATEAYENGLGTYTNWTFGLTRPVSLIDELNKVGVLVKKVMEQQNDSSFLQDEETESMLADYSKKRAGALEAKRKANYYALPAALAKIARREYSTAFEWLTMMYESAPVEEQKYTAIIDNQSTEVIMSKDRIGDLIEIATHEMQVSRILAEGKSKGLGDTQQVTRTSVETGMAVVSMDKLVGLYRKNAYFPGFEDAAKKYEILLAEHNKSGDSPAGGAVPVE